MQANILNKMTSLLSRFAKVRILFMGGEIVIKHDWCDPNAKASFDNFEKSIKEEYAKKNDEKRDPEKQTMEGQETGITAWAIRTYHKQRRIRRGV